MKRITLRTGFLGLIVVAIASLSSVLTACATTSQNQSTSHQAPSPTATNAGETKQMEHGSMQHGGMQQGGMDHAKAMDLGPSDAEYDLRFMDAMVPHHQGAVEMAKQALQKSKRPEIKQLAENIIKDQDKEIAQMKQWRQTWYPKASAEPVAYNSEMGHSMPMSSEQMKSMMMNQDLGPADVEFDLRFINAMIPHHQGAVTMAKDAQSKSKRPQIKQLAQAIVTSQQAEIKQMEEWRKAWYKQ